MSEDLDLETEDEFSDAASCQQKVQKIRLELKQVQTKRDEYLVGWQREKADGINIRKNAIADAERRAIREKTQLVEDIIPVLDSFDMAADTEAWLLAEGAFRDGIQHVRNQLLDVLARHGVERYGKTGEMFDPRLHEALQETDDSPGKAHSIVKIIRYGYKNDDFVLRPAQVIIKR